MRDPVLRLHGKAGRSDTGSVAIMVALMLAMLIGFAALGTEVVFVLFKQRQMQATASSAALAGATALMTGHPADLTVEARAVAAIAGFTTGVAGATVTVNHPPLSGVNAGNANAVEVVVGQPQILPLSKLFYAGPWNISARAVATAGSSGNACVLALDSSNTTGVTIGNGAQVNINQCGLAVNANGSSALSVTGGAVLNAKSVTVGGGTNVNNGGAINATDGVKTYQPAVTNPYTGTAVPTGSGCKYNSRHLLGYQNPTISADGVYCGGLLMDSGGSVKMNPGIYIINGGSFSLQGGVTLTGTGVTIVLTGSGGNYATASIANGASVSLSAPTDTGLLFFQDPAAPTSLNSSFQGGASESLTGALYFPTQTVTYSNGTSTAAVCTHLVAWRIVFQGGASFNSNCAGTGVDTIGGSVSELVE